MLFEGGEKRVRGSRGRRVSARSARQPKLGEAPLSALGCSERHALHVILAPDCNGLLFLHRGLHSAAASAFYAESSVSPRHVEHHYSTALRCAAGDWPRAEALLFCCSWLCLGMQSRSQDLAAGVLHNRDPSQQLQAPLAALLARVRDLLVPALDPLEGGRWHRLINSVHLPSPRLSSKNTPPFWQSQALQGVADGCRFQSRKTLTKG